MWHQPPGTDVCITFKFSLMRGRFRNPSPTSCRPAMVPFVVPISSLEALSMCYSTCRSVNLGWYGTPVSQLETFLGATPCLDAILISPHSHAPNGGLCENERASNRRSWHQVSKQVRCDRFRLCEDVARFKRERRRRLKLSLLVFFLDLYLSFLYLWSPSFVV